MIHYRCPNIQIPIFFAKNFFQKKYFFFRIPDFFGGKWGISGKKKKKKKKTKFFFFLFPFSTSLWYHLSTESYLNPVKKKKKKNFSIFHMILYFWGEKWSFHNCKINHLTKSINKKIIFIFWPGLWYHLSTESYLNPVKKGKKKKKKIFFDFSYDIVFLEWELVIW